MCIIGRLGLPWFWSIIRGMPSDQGSVRQNRDRNLHHHGTVRTRNMSSPLKYRQNWTGRHVTDLITFFLHADLSYHIAMWRPSIEVSPTPSRATACAPVEHSKASRLLLFHAQPDTVVGANVQWKHGQSPTVYTCSYTEFVMNFL